MTIGCADDYRVLIMRQPGNMTGQQKSPTCLTELSEIISLRWGRVLSNVGGAQVVVEKCPSNCQFLAPPLNEFGSWDGVYPWAYEVWIYRDGQLAFMGPIVYIRQTADNFVIDAQDMIGYVGRREMITFFSITNNPTQIAYSLLTTFFPPSDPDLLDYVQVLGNASGSMSVEYDRAQYVILQKWQDLIQAGFNYTTFGRRIFLYGEDPPNINNPYMLDANNILGDVEIVLDGLDYGNHVVGLGEGLTSGVGPSAGDQSFFGKITFPPTKFNDIRVQAELDSVTTTFYGIKRDLTPELVIPAGSTLSPSTEVYNLGYTFTVADPLALNELVCGLRYDVQVNEPFCQPGRFPQKLAELSVTWNPDQGEKIAVTFTGISS